MATITIRRSANPWGEGLLILACIAPSFLVGLYGLNRPYDAIPDQDMLWASEALRLLRGVAPSYADHPGLFWTLTYKLNISILENLLGLQLLDQAGNILPAGLETITALARIENALLVGLCSALTYPLALLLSIRKPLAIASCLILSLSSATLVAVSEIRHEAISALFLILFILCIGYSFNENLNRALSFALSLTGICCFFLAALSKQQVLLCSPLAFIAVVAALRPAQPHAYESRLRLLRNPRPQWLAILLITASAPWLIAAHPDIDLINLPAWILINVGLALATSASLENSKSKNPLIKALLFIGAFEIFLFKILIPNWWRQAVTGFPSWMFRHADHTNDHTAHTLGGISTYLSELFTPYPIAAVALIGAALTGLLLAARQKDSTGPGLNAGSIAMALAWLITLAILVASSQRITSRYEIYFFIPIVILAAATTGTAMPVSPQPLHRQLLLVNRAFTATLLLTAFISSATHVTNLKAFVNNGQPRSFLCFGQHMDRAMALTSAAACKNFNEASRAKNQYDAWNGPQ